jgi:hypothetical protein
MKRETEIEMLDVYNIIEVQKMREILKEHDDLLALFNCLMLVVNQRLNLPSS